MLACNSSIATIAADKNEEERTAINTTPAKLPLQSSSLPPCARQEADFFLFFLIQFLFELKPHQKTKVVSRELLVDHTRDLPDLSSSLLRPLPGCRLPFPHAGLLV
jgi:hypothetical protein